MSKTQVIDLSRPILFSMEDIAFIDKFNSAFNKDGSFNAVLQVAERSRNNSEYPFEDLRKSLEHSDSINEKIANRVWFGESGHPKRGCDMSRLFSVETDNVSHLIESWSCNKSTGEFYGKIRWMKPKGPTFESWMKEGGSNIAFSIRSYTPNYVKKTDKQGNSYVVKKFPLHIVTYDAVQVPGHTKARIIDPDKFSMNNQDYQDTLAQNGMYSEEFLDPSKTLKEMMSMEDSHKIIEDLFGIDSLENANVIYHNNGRATISYDSGVNLDMHLDTIHMRNVFGK